MRRYGKSCLVVAIKNHFRTVAAFILVAISSSAVAKDDLHLDNPLGHHRLLVVCLLDDDNTHSENLDILYENTDWDGFSERDLFFIEMRSDSWHIVRWQMVLNPETGHEYAMWQRIKNTSNDLTLRKESSCRNNLEFVLIGNDGTQKVRWKNSIPPGELFDRIDSMPFRQLEIRHQNKWR